MRPRRLTEACYGPRKVSSWRAMSREVDIAMGIKDSIVDAIGETPLVRLSRLAAGLKPQLLAKIEAMNPGGSI